MALVDGLVQGAPVKSASWMVSWLSLHVVFREGCARSWACKVEAAGERPDLVAPRPRGTRPVPCSMTIRLRRPTSAPAKASRACGAVWRFLLSVRERTGRRRSRRGDRQRVALAARLAALGHFAQDSKRLRSREFRHSSGISSRLSASAASPGHNCGDRNGLESADSRRRSGPARGTPGSAAWVRMTKRELLQIEAAPATTAVARPA